MHKSIRSSSKHFAYIIYHLYNDPELNMELEIEEELNESLLNKCTNKLTLKEATSSWLECENWGSETLSDVTKPVCLIKKQLFVVSWLFHLVNLASPSLNILLSKTPLAEIGDIKFHKSLSKEKVDRIELRRTAVLLSHSREASN